MKALFVGGPWNGEVREITRPGDVIVAPSRLNVTDMVNDAFNGQDVWLERNTRYWFRRAAFFGRLINLYVDEDIASSPFLDQTLGLLLLKDEFHEAVA